MEVDAFVADSVVAAEGKLYVQGAGWNIIWTQAVPFRQPRVGVGVLIHVPWLETNKMHEFSVKVVDSDDNAIVLALTAPEPGAEEAQVFEIKGQFSVGRPPLLPAGDEQVVPVAMNLDSLEFAQHAMYNVIIGIDGEPVKRIPIRIQPMVQGPQQMMR